MPHWQISNLYFSPFWTQVHSKSPSHPHFLLHTPSHLQICPAPSTPVPISLQSLPGFTLLPDSLEFTIVPYPLSESPVCHGNNPQLKESPPIPPLSAPRLPSSIRKGTKQMDCASQSCFISTSLQTLQQLWTNSWFPLFLTFCAQVFPISRILGGPTAPDLRHQLASCHFPSPFPILAHSNSTKRWYNFPSIIPQNDFLSLFFYFKGRNNLPHYQVSFTHSFNPVIPIILF